MRGDSCCQDGRVESLQDAPAVLLGVGADVRPYDQGYAGDAGQSAEASTTEANNAVPDASADVAGCPLSPRQRVDRIADQEHADADLEGPGIDIREHARPDRNPDKAGDDERQH